MNSIAHIEINVSNINLSRKFYELVLSQLGWKCLESKESESVGFCAPDKTHLYLVQTNEEYLEANFHRKQTGLNHIAFRVDSKVTVEYISQFLKDNSISTLYHSSPKDYTKEYGVSEYFAIFFEDPDRIKIEIVYIN